MTSRVFTPEPLDAGVVLVGRKVYETTDPRWYEKAACKNADPKIFEVGSTNNRKNPVAGAMEFCLKCTERSNCVIDALAYKDVGVIRGGIKFEKSKFSVCCRCDLPVAPPGKKYCTFCAMTRRCETCGKSFVARHTWLHATTCKSCLEAARQERIRVRGRRVRKPVKKRFVILRRRR